MRPFGARPQTDVNDKHLEVTELESLKRRSAQNVYHLFHEEDDYVKMALIKPQGCGKW